MPTLYGLELKLKAHKKHTRTLKRLAEHKNLTEETEELITDIYELNDIIKIHCFQHDYDNIIKIVDYVERDYSFNALLENITILLEISLGYINKVRKLLDMRELTFVDL